MQTLPKSVLERPVTGVNLMPGSLGDQIGPKPTLLVFLRHFGCIFCRETVGDLREAAGSVPDFPPLLFFTQGTPTESKAFLRRLWPEARAVSDPELALYAAFGVRRARLVEAFGPRVWGAQRRAAAKGHRQGPRSGDIWRMPGVFLACGDRVLWSYEPKHAGDHPDFARIPERTGLRADA